MKKETALLTNFIYALMRSELINTFKFLFYKLYVTLCAKLKSADQTSLKKIINIVTYMKLQPIFSRAQKIRLNF